MPMMAILIGTALVLVGFGGYSFASANGSASPTALIPAAFGILIFVCGLLAMIKESLRKHSMHAALAIALLGMIGTASGLIKVFTLIGGGEVERPVAVVSQASTSILCLVFIVFGVMSFVNARKKRTA